MPVSSDDKPIQKKRLGQVFLRSRGCIRKVLSFADFTSEDTVLEIGGGDGSVSAELAKIVDSLCVIELDQEFLDVLKKRFEEQLNVQIVSGNILDPDTLITALARLQTERISVYGSIPYYITTQIVRWVLENRKYIRRAVLLMQKEVAQRLAAKHASKEYGYTSVLVQLGASLRLGPIVGRKSFMPVPKVDSQVIELDLKSHLHEDFDPRFISMLSRLFNQRRKMIGTTLKSDIFDKDSAEAMLTEQGLSLNMRPEQLTPEQHLALFRTLFSK